MFCKWESVFFNIFTLILHTLPISRYFFCVEQINNISFKLKLILLIQRLLKQCLINVSHQFFLAIQSHEGLKKLKYCIALKMNFKLNQLFLWPCTELHPYGKKNRRNILIKHGFGNLCISSIDINLKENFLFVQHRKIS